jgi:hypothetical protein
LARSSASESWSAVLAPPDGRVGDRDVHDRRMRGSRTNAAAISSCCAGLPEQGAMATGPMIRALVEHWHVARCMTVRASIAVDEIARRLVVW